MYRLGCSSEDLLRCKLRFGVFSPWPLERVSKFTSKSCLRSKGIGVILSQYLGLDHFPVVSTAQVLSCVVEAEGNCFKVICGFADAVILDD